MDTKNSEEVLDRLHKVLYKLPAGGGRAPGDPICEPGEVISLKVSDVLGVIDINPMLRWGDINTNLPEIRLDEESELKFGALLMHMVNYGANTEFGVWLRGVTGHGSSLYNPEDVEKLRRFSERLREYIKRQQIAHAEPERLVAAFDELGEPESVSAVLGLLREADPERADAVAALLPPSPEAMQAEIEALRRQVSELAAERDALLKAQLP